MGGHIMWGLVDRDKDKICVYRGTIYKLLTDSLTSNDENHDPQMTAKMAYDILSESLGCSQWRQSTTATSVTGVPSPPVVQVTMEQCC